MLRLIGRTHRAILGAALAVSLPAVAPRDLQAQTDYYNTDAGRPLQVEDYLALERHGLELQAAPVRVERGRGGAYTWGVEPELAWGLLPRTHVELGMPLASVDRGAASGGRVGGVAGVDLSLFHQLNVETSLPGLALAGDVLLPMGGLGPARAHVSVVGIATRTTSLARFHANARYTFGPGSDGSDGAVELSRWLAGLAVDHTFALRSVLVGGEVVMREPLDGGREEIAIGVGTRAQLSPRWALDGGIGRRVTGDEQGWYLTAGTAYAFGLPGLMRRGAR